MSSYNYDQFSAGKYNLDDSTGPLPGQAAPDFDVTRRDGSNVRLLDFSGDFLVLELGSITCPLFQGQRQAMQCLARDNPDISFAVLYVREAHPGDTIVQHRGMKDKTACAAQLAEHDQETREILIDDLNGTAHRAYGSYPNSVFIINRHHTVVFQSDWNNVNATRRALEKLQQGQPATVRSFFTPTYPTVVIRTLRRAGNGSARDFFTSLPQLIWKNLIKRNLHTLVNRPKAVPPDQAPVQESV